MRCGKAREHISLDLDGQLRPDRATGLMRHLDECADCRRYREDLVLGRRLLAATEPQLPENFEWRLQLKLNQTLAQAAAESLHPWHERPADRGAWLRNFGAAAAVGMAAVLAVAMLAGPHIMPTTDTTAPAVSSPVVDARQAVGGGDRLDLDRPAGGLPWTLEAGTGQRQVSGGQALLGRRSSWQARRPWTYQSVEELRAQHQRRLERENQQLRAQVFQYERQLRALQSPLDTTAVPVLEQGADGDEPRTAR